MRRAIFLLLASLPHAAHARVRVEEDDASDDDEDGGMYPARNGRYSM